MQAASCPREAPAGRSSAGSVTLHSSTASGQRGWKRQPRRDPDCVRCLAAQDLEPLPLARVRGAARRRAAPSCTDAAGLSITSPAGPCSTIRPRYMTAIRSAKQRGRREVVRDHQHCEPALAQPVEERQDSRADGDVEHRDRLVGDEQARLEDERRRDRDPLALPTRELVRVAVEEELRRRSSTRSSASRDPIRALAPSSRRAVDEERLLDRVAARGGAGRATRTGPGRRSGSRAAAGGARAAGSAVMSRPS